MNHDCFSISRFRKFFIYDLRNGIHRNGPSLLICLGVYMLIWIFMSAVLKVVTPPQDREKLFSAIFFIFTTMTPMVIYGHVNDLKKGTPYILLPVTVLEKYLSMTLLCFLFWPAAGLIMLRGMDDFLTAVGGTDWGYVEYMPFAGMDGSFSSFEGITSTMLVISIFICGALLFRQCKYGLTLMSFIVLFIIWVQLGKILPFMGDIHQVMRCLGIIAVTAFGYLRLKNLKY